MTPPRSSRTQRVRRTGNWVNLSTPIGLLVARAGGASIRRGPRGLILADGYRPRFPIASAFTVGNVVITGGQWSSLLVERPTLLQHEERHTWQWFALLGLPFLPAYAAAMGWSVLRTGDRAAANLFERHAGLAHGGYREVPPRRLLGGSTVPGALRRRGASAARRRLRSRS